jgi:hypothetical protein
VFLFEREKLGFCKRYDTLGFCGIWMVLRRIRSTQRLHVVVQVRNFVQLCVDGYYNGTIFHRLIKTFMVQGGDPTGTGTGKWFMNEMRRNIWVLVG